MEEQRDALARRRRTGSKPRRRSSRPARGSRPSSSATRRRTCSTQVGALEEFEDGRFLAKLRESPFYPEGGGQVTDAGFLEHEGTGARAELREAFRVEDDQVLLFEGVGFAAGDRVRAVVPWSTRYPTIANHTATHLLHRALQLRPRRGREAGRLGGAAGQAPLRLHAFAAAQRRGARWRSSGS